MQPFFLSRTRLHVPQYSLHAVHELLERMEAGPDDYLKNGIFVLRATVMSPYIVLAAETGRAQAYLGTFMETLAQRTEEAILRVHQEALQSKLGVG